MAWDFEAKEGYALRNLIQGIIFHKIGTIIVSQKFILLTLKLSN